MDGLLFGDIVVVEEDLIGVVVKTWANMRNEIVEYEVYVREENCIKIYQAKDVQRYRVRHKYLNEEELRFQKGGG